MLFPARAGTRLLLHDEQGRLPSVSAVLHDPTGAMDGSARVAEPGGAALLIEHSRESFLRPGLRGHRPDGSGWSCRFAVTSTEVHDARLSWTAVDPDAGLELRTEVEAMAGGAVRVRHQLTNVAESVYHLQALEVSVPVPDSHVELLDFTGRHLGERRPQRHCLADGVWLREVRRGRTSLESPTLLAAGVPGFGFEAGELIAVHVAFSGNTVLAAERDPHEGSTLRGGELLLPGEITLATADSYLTPWVVVLAADGLDEAAAALHRWARSLPAHPATQQVVLNVWEAVYFDHDLRRLTELAERAARVGVERFVLDDGWFRGRRDATRGLGDWTVDPEVWPRGLTPLIDRVHELGMSFGLWFEPEMVNPDSELFRAHPDWILQVPGRLPPPRRSQFVLDLAQPQVWRYVRDSVDAVLSDNAVDYVKWDHNRDLHEAASPQRSGRAVVHEQTLAYYALLEELRARHPQVQWESCASGGGRIDLGVIERVERFWTSDLTDALARQQIQRWSAQLIAPEYLGAHVSAPTSHQTGRTFSLDFRAATALFGAFGIEWDLAQASPADLDRLAGWTRLHKRLRPLLHSGRTIRLDRVADGALAHGVVAEDRSRAVLGYVQLVHPGATRPIRLRVPGLLPQAHYRASILDPDGERTLLDGTMRGDVLGQVGVPLPTPRAETVTLISLTLLDAGPDVGS